jgi:hypothetical protein
VPSLVSNTSPLDQLSVADIPANFSSADKDEVTQRGDM